MNFLSFKSSINVIYTLVEGYQGVAMANGFCDNGEMEMRRVSTTQEHPGEALKEELDRRGWNQVDLTFVLGCGPKAINQIVNGKQGISPAMSKALGEALGLPRDHFANLQKAFDLACASEPDPSVTLRAKMQASYPIREMVKRGWLREDSAEVLGIQLADFFGVSDPCEIPHLSHAAKKTSYEDEISGAQLAWLFRVKQIAKSISVPTYSESKLRGALEQMAELRTEPEEARKVPRLLSECGVRFVVVEGLPGSKIDGVCFWLDDRSPVIGMTMRFDRLDNFWFVLRHEIEHALCGHGRSEPCGMIDADLQGDSAGTGNDVPKEESIANAAAADFCVPKNKIESFLLRKHPFYYEKDILAFAKVNKLHPALVIGQIQHRLNRYDYLKKHQSKIRQFVLPGAIVDGWGQSVPVN